MRKKTFARKRAKKYSIHTLSDWPQQAYTNISPAFTNHILPCLLKLSSIHFWWAIFRFRRPASSAPQNKQTVEADWCNKTGMRRRLCRYHVWITTKIPSIVSKIPKMSGWRARKSGKTAATDVAGHARWRVLRGRSKKRISRQVCTRQVEKSTTVGTTQEAQLVFGVMGFRVVVDPNGEYGYLSFYGVHITKTCWELAGTTQVRVYEAVLFLPLILTIILSQTRMFTYSSRRLSSEWVTIRI